MLRYEKTGHKQWLDGGRAVLTRQFHIDGTRVTVTRMELEHPVLYIVDHQETYESAPIQHILPKNKIVVY